MKILVLNPGSNSLKFEVIETEAGESDDFGSVLVSGSYDGIGNEHSSFSVGPNRSALKKTDVQIRDCGHAAESVFTWIHDNSGRRNRIPALNDIEAIGCRIVHGGDRFRHPAELTDEVLGQIEELKNLAPLHNESALKVIRAARDRMDNRVPMFGIFDTAFHCTIPEHAALYGLPLELAKKHKIRRYGFHGISHRYLMLRYAQLANKPASELKLITLHRRVAHRRQRFEMANLRIPRWASRRWKGS